jgi:type I restriction enzyme R subunit
MGIPWWERARDGATGPSPAMLPEARARKSIDGQLTSAGWIVQNGEDINLGAGLGVAVREFSVATGATDYPLYVDRKACGVLEAKPEGVRSAPARRSRLATR